MTLLKLNRKDMRVVDLSNEKERTTIPEAGQDDAVSRRGEAAAEREEEDQSREAQHPKLEDKYAAPVQMGDEG